MSVNAFAATPDHTGLFKMTDAGSVGVYGTAVNHGNELGSGSAMSAMFASPTGKGYVLSSQNGGAFAFGDAVFHGSSVLAPPSALVVGIAMTPNGGGYAQVALDGSVYNFGTSVWYGNGTSPNNIVCICYRPQGDAYWMVDDQGGVYGAYGAGGPQNYYGNGSAPGGGFVTGMDCTPTGLGYWIVGTDGGVSTHGDAGFYGSLPPTVPAAPIIGIRSSPSGHGYWLIGSDGGLFNYGDAPFIS